ncbi:MAG: DegT/DnrJ/EryC1/StrS family aminotransferase [Phycisphaerae bacterium]
MTSHSAPKPSGRIMPTRNLERGSEAPIPMFNLTRQYAQIGPELEAAALSVLSSTDYVGGPMVTEFENRLGEFCGCHAIAISSGTDAILAGLMALGIGKGDAVITTPFTFFATAGCISRIGGRPIFVDINPDTFLIDEACIKQAVTPAVRCIIPVHLFGQMTPMKSLVKFACESGISVLEDAAQSIGAHDPDGIVPAELGAAAALSFYPTKNLGAAGDAGALLTRMDSFAGRVRQTRQHGEVTRYMHEFVGGNFRLDALQCAILNAKLRHLDRWNQRRAAIADFYDQALAGTDVKIPGRLPGAGHVFHQYVIRAPRRDELREYLTRHGIGSAVYYPVPLHLQKCFADLGYKAGSLPTAETACREVLALPIFPELTQEELDRTADAIRAFFGYPALS